MAVPGMSGSYVNKVVINGEVKLNLTEDTVLEDKLLGGVTAHDKSGRNITGTIATYAGSTSVTPGTSAQTLQTAGKYLDANIIIAAAQASGKQVATGSVTPTRNNLYNRSVSVSGLGFAPATVVLYLASASTGPDNSYDYVLVSISGAWSVCASSKTELSFCYKNTESSALRIKLDTGGFTLYTSDSTYGVFTSEYNYIAIGA